MIRTGRGTRCARGTHRGRGLGVHEVHRGWGKFLCPTQFTAFSLSVAGKLEKPEAKVEKAMNNRGNRQKYQGNPGTTNNHGKTEMRHFWLHSASKSEAMTREQKLPEVIGEISCKKHRLFFTLVNPPFSWFHHGFPGFPTMYMPNYECRHCSTHAVTENPAPTTHQCQNLTTRQKLPSFWHP